MADFHQNGNITTLHNLRTRELNDLEYELTTYAQTRRISLILPSLFSELEGEALPHILDELAKVPYLHRIIIGLDRADESQFRHARSFFARLPQTHTVIWNDSPRMKALDERLARRGLAPQEPGKGKNVWTSIGYLTGLSGGQPRASLPDVERLLSPDRRRQAERSGDAAAGFAAADRVEKGDRRPRLHRLPAQLPLSVVG